MDGPIKEGVEDWMARREVPAKTHADPGPVSAASETSANGCLHGRLIEDVLTEDGQRSGKVRCLECGTQFDSRDHTR